MHTEKNMNAGGLEGLKELYELCQTQLADIVKLVRSDIKKLARCTCQALIVLEVHGKDVLGELIDDKICDVTEFDWLRQLRYYWEEDTMTTRMTNAQLSYM